MQYSKKILIRNNNDSDNDKIKNIKNENGLVSENKTYINN